ncbi:MAG TPA: AAA family ATPase, partial [Candidatus Obscuribacterales bacterium]
MKEVISEAGEILRQRAEQQFAQELAEIEKVDNKQRPPNWRLSPWAVCTYILGGKLDNRFAITPKYIGNRRLIEIAISTLATDRALLLLGVPGTAKSWVSEHLAAAISGDSSLVVQGTAGTPEEAMRYGWNYARLLSEGPSVNALVASPIMRAMKEGMMARVEELTRIPADVQDTLITILSEKTLPVPELNEQIQAVKGFNVIATANDRDRGVNELSSALRRRFNTVVLPVPDTLEEEVEIVSQRCAAIGRALELPGEPPALEQIRRIVVIFRELRSGVTADGKTKLKSPSGTMSTAEAISVVNN